MAQGASPFGVADKHALVRSILGKDPAGSPVPPSPNDAVPAGRPQGGPPLPGAEGGGEHGFGTQLSEYAGPESGPFECENCAHWDEQSPKSCNEPHVMADPEVEKVEAEGCCRFFEPGGGVGGGGEAPEAPEGEGEDEDKGEAAPEPVEEEPPNG